MYTVRSWSNFFHIISHSLLEVLRGFCFKLYLVLIYLICALFITTSRYQCPWKIHTKFSTWKISNNLYLRINGVTHKHKQILFSKKKKILQIQSTRSELFFLFIKERPWNYILKLYGSEVNYNWRIDLV